MYHPRPESPFERVMEIENAQIENTHFGPEDHNIMTFYIYMAGDGWGQGFGGYAIDQWNEKTSKRDIGYGPAIILIRDILTTLDCDSWEKLKGKYCRVARDDGLIVGIGHPVKNKWVMIKDYFKKQEE